MLKNDKFKTILNRFVAMTLLMFLIMNSSISFVHAQTAEDRLKEYKSEKEKAKKLLQQIKEDKTSNIDAIRELEKDIEKVQVEIKQTEDEIKETQKIVNEITGDLKEQQESYAKQEVLVKKRLTFMYEQGEHSAWELLLKSDGIMNFLSNYYMLQELSAIDNEILSESSKNKRKIEILKKELDSKEKLLNEAKKRLIAKEASFKSIKFLKDEKTKSLNKEEKKTLADIENIEEKEKEAQREIERRAAQHVGNTVYVGGEFGWPAPGASSITTYFGEYYEYSTSYHKGLDISGPGYQSIVAANDGFVVEIENDVPGFDYVRQYGNHVILDHGGGWFTMYAHGKYDSVVVRPGQRVKRGQHLMTMGDTGYSFGQHLHFELVKSPKPYYYSGVYRIDPLPYLK